MVRRSYGFPPSKPAADLTEVVMERKDGVAECCGEFVEVEQKREASDQQWNADGDDDAKIRPWYLVRCLGFPQASQCHSTRSVVGSALIWVPPSKPAADLTEVMTERTLGDGVAECCDELWKWNGGEEAG